MADDTFTFDSGRVARMTIPEHEKCADEVELELFIEWLDLINKKTKRHMNNRNAEQQPSPTKES